jgi:demethylmenaquinone methyltransferase / 2-methoxy-6-polyprenyl-1,4-benzoquinol methylase
VRQESLQRRSNLARTMNKGGAVREMFGRIARRYDFTNSVMTGGTDALWRRKAVSLLRPEAGAALLDLACGTGALTRECAKAVPSGRVIGVDFTPQMLEIARRSPRPNVEYREADVLHLPFADGEFDGATMAFSLRNIVDIDACLREIARVLKPGGAFVNLEVSKPRNVLWRRAFYAYFYGLVPVIGRIVGHDAAAYRYLPESLVNFPDADALALRFAAAGFINVRHLRLMGGVAALHIGYATGAARRPEPAVAEAALP